jgi:hypothetical protein
MMMHGNHGWLNLSIPGSKDLWAVADELILECHANKIALRPGQSALPCGAKVIKGYFEVQRINAKAVQAKSGADVGNIAYAAREYPALCAEEQ